MDELTTAYDAAYGTSMPTNMPTSYYVFLTIWYIVLIVAQWKIFEKAGEAGWKSLIPIYNMVIWFKIVGMSPWLVLLCFVPIANIIVLIMAYDNLAKCFGQGTGFAIGLIFLGPIFEMILGFGNSTYTKPQEN